MIQRPVLQRENPARTDDIVGSVAVVDATGVDDAVRRARSGQRAWAAISVDDRAKALLAGADRIAAELETLAVLMARETGKVLPDCRGELGFAVTVLRWSADRCVELLADQVIDDELGRLLLRRRPYGVIAAVTPWNAPVILAVLKLGPALVSGNGVVVKPSPLAPFAISRVVELLAEGLPDGTVQVVHGDAETATALVGHRGIDRVAFTGGDAAGRAIAALAGQSLTPTLMELGGNDPAILLEDADLTPDAMDRLVIASYATSGQVCMAVEAALRSSASPRRGRRRLSRRRSAGAAPGRPAPRRRHPRTGRDRGVRRTRAGDGRGGRRSRCRGDGAGLRGPGDRSG